MPKAPARRAISRFIVMAMLQAARAERLGLARPSAYSWGLNRAIFYAAAKAGFKSGGPGEGSGGDGKVADGRAPYHLGEELAYRDPTRTELYFTIGGDTQTEREFQKQIIDRFGPEENFRTAWAEAQAVVAEAPVEELQTGPQFYARVYKPRRDALRESWTERFVRGDPTH